MTRHLNKTYWHLGPFEVQYGHLSHSLAVFWQRPWRRIMVLQYPTKLGGVHG